MKKQTISISTVISGKEAKFLHHSDGTELIPSEISSDFQNDNILVSGYTIDDEGIMNNYGVEPAMSAATYPTPKQQWRYVFWGVGAMAFVTTILFIAFSVS